MAHPVVLAGLMDSLDITNLDDTGMYIWAGILTVGLLAISWGVAIGWQRWRAPKKDE